MHELSAVEAMVETALEKAEGACAAYFKYRAMATS